MGGVGQELGHAVGGGAVQACADLVHQQHTLQPMQSLLKHAAQCTADRALHRQSMLWAVLAENVPQGGDHCAMCRSAESLRSMMLFRVY